MAQTVCRFRVTVVCLIAIAVPAISNAQPVPRSMRYDEFRTLGTRWKVIRNIPEVPLFVDSHASRAVQLADHIAYAVYRRYEAKDTSFLDVIASRFDEEGGVIHGLAHKQTIDPDCRCLACATRR